MCFNTYSKCTICGGRDEISGGIVPCILFRDQMFESSDEDPYGCSPRILLEIPLPHHSCWFNVHGSSDEADQQLKELQDQIHSRVEFQIENWDPFGVERFWKQQLNQNNRGVQHGQRAQYRQAPYQQAQSQQLQYLQAQHQQEQY